MLFVFTAIKIRYMRFKEALHKNYDVSVVIPFYKKMEEFRHVFSKNQKKYIKL